VLERVVGLCEGAGAAEVVEHLVLRVFPKMRDRLFVRRKDCLISSLLEFVLEGLGRQLERLVPADEHAWLASTILLDHRHGCHALPMRGRIHPLH